MLIIRKIISVIAFIATCVTASNIVCEAPLQTTCIAIEIEKIESINETIEIVGSENGAQYYPAVTGFYAISKDLDMQYIPSNIFKIMPNLEYFYAYEVNLKQLPTDSFKRCSKLHQISLAKNSIETLGQGFAIGCSNAYLLDLSYNQITELTAASFKGLTSLTTLTINFNFIEVIGKGTFDTMPVLTLISMSMNKISTVHPNAFMKLSNLGSLVLNDNRIKVIKSGWFANKNFLATVNLQSNEISAIEPNFLTEWTSSNLNTTKSFNYELNLMGNNCIKTNMKEISDKTTKYYENSLYKCFEEYENNYFFKNFP
ncbi:unnamed protein product [Chironomus riparius]|uniref:Uncharacterized protein n=1 Tax=Chironomus riparius TaxID=315576 RepID=A0A9N9WQF1_9DIPT|nr:unnamed protein product [Chironomus riparius]